MRRKVSKTRMELMRTRKRLDLAQRGHKLLKDKLEGLMKELNDRLPEYKDLRLKVDEQWPNVFRRFALADADASAAATEAAIFQARPRVEVRSEIERIMGVVVTKAEATVRDGGSTYSLVQTSPHLDGALAELKALLPDLIKLAGLEQAVRALAEEIQRTRRRSNALEHVLIPDLEETQKVIASSIEEMARSEISRLMKVKEMLLERRDV
jgi:V/A-type H+-transporting ATPase subunit D